MSLEQKLLTDEPETLMAALHDALHEMEYFIPSNKDAVEWFAILERRPDANRFSDWIAYQRLLLGIDQT